MNLNLNKFELIWMNLVNVETMFSFLGRLSQRWLTSKERCEFDRLQALKNKARVKSKIFSYLAG